MGVIDKDRRAIMLADLFQPALCAFEMFERREHLIRFAAGTDRQSCRDQRILDLEFADQRQPDRISSPAMHELKPLRKAVRCPTLR